MVFAAAAFQNIYLCRWLSAAAGATVYCFRCEPFEAAALSQEAAGLTLPLLWPDDSPLCDPSNHSLVVEAAQ